MSQLAIYTSVCSRRRVPYITLLFAGLLSSLPSHPLLAQTSSAPSASGPASGGGPNSATSEDHHLVDIENRLNDVTTALSRTQQMLEKSQAEIQRLHAEIDALRAQTPSPPAKPGTAETQNSSAAADNPASGSGVSPKDDLSTLREEMDAMQAEIKQHDQIKVETASKYPLRVSGLALFNAFSNAGVVDDIALPTFALPRPPGASHGSTGATLRQTLLALEATGPRLGGARSSAEVSIDLFGGVASNEYGYSASAGVVRMRQALASVDWDKTTVQASFAGPLVSPLSPASYATVAQPALAGSGNLWTWSPQLRLEQLIPISDQYRLALEVGLIDPQSPGYTSTQLDSPVEAARHPGYEGRISFHAHDTTSGTARPFVLGFGGYSADQFYNNTTHILAWAATGDWQVPFGTRLELTGEAYRGSALGGLGGGAYKDVLTGTDTTTGLSRTMGVDTEGGWSQLKLRFGSTFETNAIFGMDDALARNFAGLMLSASNNPLELYARNQSVVGNVIFRPKTYLILSPEYRRLLSWRYAGSANVANIFTLNAGYQF